MKYRVETESFVALVEVSSNGTIIDSAPILSRFIGQQYNNLYKWIQLKFKNIYISKLHRMDILEFIESKVPKLLNLTGKVMDSMDKFNLEPTNMMLDITFYPIEYDDSGKALVIVGTSNIPAGISKSNADFVLFFNRATNGYKMVFMDDLKAIIRSRWNELKKDICKDFKHMGIYMNVNEL